MKSIEQSSLLIVSVLPVLVGLWMAGCSRRAVLDLEPYRALGLVAAEETAKLLGNKGRVVIVTAVAPHTVAADRGGIRPT